MNDWWVKDYISTLEWGWFTDVPTAHFWEYVRLRANRFDQMFQDMKVERGSFITSVAKMSIESGLSEKQVRLAMSKLEKTGEITTKRTNKYTLITVVKYAYFQGECLCEDKQKDTQGNTQWAEQASWQRATIRENKREVTRENKREECPPIRNTTYYSLSPLEGEPKPKNRFIKPTLEEVESYCRERGKGVDPQRWYDFYTANGWMVGKNKMKDWKASVRYWERNNPSHTEVSTEKPASERYRMDF